MHRPGTGDNVMHFSFSTCAPSHQGVGMQARRLRWPAPGRARRSGVWQHGLQPWQRGVHSRDGSDMHRIGASSHSGVPSTLHMLLQCFRLHFIHRSSDGSVAGINTSMCMHCRWPQSSSSCQKRSTGRWSVRRSQCVASFLLQHRSHAPRGHTSVCMCLILPVCLSAVASTDAEVGFML